MQIETKRRIEELLEPIAQSINEGKREGEFFIHQTEGVLWEDWTKGKFEQYRVFGRPVGKFSFEPTHKEWSNLGLNDLMAERGRIVIGGAEWILTAFTMYPNIQPDFWQEDLPCGWVLFEHCG